MLVHHYLVIIANNIRYLLHTNYIGVLYDSHVCLDSIAFLLYCHRVVLDVADNYIFVCQTLGMHHGHNAVNTRQ